MKKLVLTCALAVVSALAMAQAPADKSATQQAASAQKAPTGNAVIKFEEETFDFGNVPQGPPSVKHEFKVTNNGSDPLILNNVQPSCGCTTPHWPKEPIMPGNSAEILIEYNALHTGAFTKSITVTSNATEPTKVIYIKGNVEAKPVEQTTPEKQPSMISK